MGQSLPTDTFCVPLPSTQVAGEELQELQCLHESTYRLAQRFCEHGDLASRHIFMQHGPLPEKEEDIQVMPRGKGCSKWGGWLTPKMSKPTLVFTPVTSYSISHSERWQGLLVKTV